jgi:hypothetical protein
MFSNLAQYHLACFLLESNIIVIFHIWFNLTFDQAKQLLQNIEITSMKLVHITKNMNSSSTNTKYIQSSKVFSLKAKISLGATIKNHLDKITRKLELLHLLIHWLFDWIRWVIHTLMKNNEHPKTYNMH